MNAYAAHGKGRLDPHKDGPICAHCDLPADYDELDGKGWCSDCQDEYACDDCGCELHLSADRCPSCEAAQYETTIHRSDRVERELDLSMRSALAMNRMFDRLFG